MKPKKNTSKKQQARKIVLTTVAVGAVGILGYFGWQYLKKRKATNTDDLDEVLKTTSTDTLVTNSESLPKAVTNPKPINTATSNKSNTGFPLKRGSKGDNVKLLQQALIKKYGKTILPKFGADGDFGTETVNALKKSGLPASIDESMFNVLTQSLKADTNSLGNDLLKATDSGNFNAVTAVLKKMKNKDDYSAANEVFKTGRINGVHQTIVNGLLSVFNSEEQKQQIKFEFLRIGLQYDGNKWSLSGYGGMPIITVQPAVVWISAKQNIKVPARMVLGNEVIRRLDYTLFENRGKYFLVHTKTVKCL